MTFDEEGSTLSPGVPKLSLAMYPFSISVDEHVPLNMGSGSFFFQTRAKSGFSRGSGVGDGGAGGASAPTKILIC